MEGDKNLSLPFDPYDFFGYLASGLVFVVGMDLVLGFPQVLGRDLKLVDGAALLIAIYIAGQIIATPAKALLEDIVVARILGLPSVNLFREKGPGLRWVFPGFYRPLPAERQGRIRERAQAQGAGTSGESLFVHVRFCEEVRNDRELIARMNSFLNKSGFSRNLSFVTLVLGVSLIVKAIVHPAPLLMRYGVTSVVVGVMLFYRYLKFFRNYSSEMFNTYASK